MTQHGLIIGVDEAGRGPLAGPVAAAAMVLPDRHGIIGLDDSKRLSERKRAQLEGEIKAICAYAIVMVAPAEIDRINILQATMAAMHRAVAQLCTQHKLSPDLILVDGNRLPDWDYSAKAVIGGDRLHPCISAASILAKQARDRLMIAADKDYLHYGWARNKGYGTSEHLAALREFGPSPLHRRSFAPVAQAELDFSG